MGSFGIRRPYLAGTSLLALTAGLLSVPTTAALAQESASDDGGMVLEEITVTSRRRSESLQSVPAAVTAFSSQTIEDAGIERPSDFVALTPNVTLVETQNAGSSFIVIRGVSQARNSEPSVAVIIDGVQQVNPAQFNQELFDIEQIEVLKGPQGALYGRNAIGGAIVVTTKQPSDELEGKVKVGMDSGPGYKAQASISGPVGQSDTLKFRLAGSFMDTDGYINNEYLDEEADPYKDFSLRGMLTWQASERFQMDLRGSMSELRTQAFYYNIVADVNDTSLPVRVNNAGQNDRDMYTLSLRMNYDADWGTFTSVSAYDKLEEILTGDAFNFLPIEESFFYGFLGFDMNQSQYLDVEAWSQELRLTSNSDQRLRWIVGAYFIGTDRYISTGNMVDTGQGVFPVYREPSTNPINPQATFLADSQDNFAWAVFGDVTYDITDDLEIDLSLRYDHDKREQTTLTPTQYLPNVPGFPAGATGDVRDRSFSEWQPKVTLRYNVSDDVSLYAGYSTGFRSGGFNQTGVGAVAFSNGIVGVNDIFEAEVAKTFEAGVKSSLMDRMMTLNASVFTTKSENSYFFVFLAANSTQNLGNVPEARLTGFELEGTLRPMAGLDLNFGLGYTDSKIKDFENPAYIGNEVPVLSRYTLNLGAQYHWDITDDVRGIMRVDYQRIGKTFWDVENSTVRRPVDLVDARIGVEWNDWSLTAWARNLFDERYNAEYSPGGFVFKAKPARYGIELSKRF
ncbi:TonB-dependent receptor [Pseudokordiimonas caeni]|uniref:TonB-dependent receptor n=1 Tax=Pseudokordiimonas caeni TaxID=2997908 RepID=UPI00281222E9|nr:TonB-dependent receptor [Pseudokordiimonas caeni]